MGTIAERQRKDGSTSYQVQIVLKREGRTVHRESKTFDLRRAAVLWMDKREAELAQPGAVEAIRTPEPTLAQTIRHYITASPRDFGKTKLQVLKAIQKDPIADLPCSAVTSPELTAWLARLAEGRTPQTVGNYLAHLRSVFAIARDAWGHPLDPAQIEAATRVAKRQGTTSRSNRRDRRPTLAELDRLMAHFAAIEERRPDSIPMRSVILFAIFSTRRLSEITRLRWEDIELDHARALVRDMKHPGEKRGNDVWVDLVPEAVAILKARKKAAEDAPYFLNSDSISAAFTRACAILGIHDLHFHDLRHEGVSRLFEMGWTIPRAARVSGHRTWSSLQRYSHLRQAGDKFAGWPHIGADS